MRVEAFNAFCRSLPATTHVVQWGGADVWKVGGKVFAIGGWGRDEPAYAFKVSRIAFEMLKDEPGLRPAPYLASRGMTWIQQCGPAGLDDEELKSYLAESHRIVSLGLTRKLRKALGLDGEGR